eukprot:SAG31_NODE_2201_length_6201_cov_14.443461_3_plen_121_part_00
MQDLEKLMRRKAKQRQKAVKAKELENIDLASEDSGSENGDMPQALEDFASETETDASHSEYDSQDEISEHEGDVDHHRRGGDDADLDDAQSETGSEYTETASETATETETEMESPAPGRR